MKLDYSLSPSSRSGRPRKPIEIAMTPMIDVIFLLLVFFLATSSFQLVEKFLPSNTSKMEDQSNAAGGAQAEPTEPTDDAIEQIVIKLKPSNGEPVVIFNEIPLQTFSELSGRLRVISNLRADVPVIIDPAGEIPAADVIQAYDWARQAGLDRVYLATRAP